MCCHGSGAAAIPHVTVVFHLQQERDLFPSQTLFPCKHFTGMCVRMSMCVCLKTQFGCFILPNGSRKKSIGGVYIYIYFFLEKAPLCLCICPCSIGIPVSVSVIFAVYSFPGACLVNKRGEGKERQLRAGRGRCWSVSRMRMKRPAVEATNRLKHRRSVRTKLKRKNTQQKTKKEDVRYRQKFMYDVRGRTEGNWLTATLETASGPSWGQTWADQRPGVWRPQAVVTH